MSETDTQATSSAAAPTRLDEWKAAKLHKNVTLPSGTKVDIILPNLPKMLQTGEVPNPLVQAAVDAQQGQRVTEETIREQFDFYKFLVAQTVKNPALHEDDVADLPFEDIEMLVELASRNRDLDAVGHHLSGLETVGAFRTFRGLDSGFAAGAGL
jgi:hypothetical protein